MIFETYVAFMQKLMLFSSYIKNNSSFEKPLTQKEEREYLEKFANGDEEAYKVLIEHNLRLVAHIVKKYNGAEEADDLISVGSLGLIKAINSYKLNHGTQFSTYAAKCIENEILMYKKKKKKHRCNVSLAESVGVDKEGNEITLMDILPVKEDSVFKKVETGILIEKVLKVIDTSLSGREHKIICLRYGIGHPRTYTQLEIAAMLGISRSYVSRIEKKAIDKIAKELNCGA